MKKIKLLLLFCVVAIAASASKTVYLVPTDKWNYDGARFALYHFSGETEGPWVDFTDSDGDGVYTATFDGEDEGWQSMIICRMNGSAPENGWSNKWTQTADIPAPVADGMTYTITSAEGAYTFSGNTVYLYNVSADKYMCSGNYWGSHVSVGEGGIPLTLNITSKTTYSISTASLYSGRYLNGEWLDSDASYDWTFESVGSGNFKIKNGDNVLYLNTGTVVSQGADPGTNASQWKVYTEAERIAAMADATKASPVNATFLIKNYYFAKGNGRIVAKDANLSSSPSWKGTSLTDLWGHDSGDTEACYCAEQYRKTFDNYQELSDIPNGEYFMTAKGFYRNDGGGYAIPYIYAGSQKCNLKLKGDDVTNLETAAQAFHGGKYLLDGVTVVVTDGNLRVGVKSDAGIDWCGFDDFYLEYHGKAVTNEALELPNDGNIVAGQWYKFVVPVDGNYTITAGTAANIIQTTNGNQLVEDATGDVITTGDEVALSEGTYFFKSFSDNTLTIEVKSYVYSVSEATSDIAYIQSGNTVTISYTVATNSGAALSQDYSGVTFNGNAISVTPTASGFTFTVPEELTTATDYTLAIPSGAIGYVAGSTYNAAQNITLTTPAIFDGVYYMYNTYTESYISRAGNYNTQAVLDNCGLAFNVSTDSENNTKLQYFDSQYWLGDDGWCYGDCTGNRVRTFNITKVTGGYKFLNTNNSKYLAANSNAVVADAVEGGNLIGTSNVWALESTEAHKANYTVNANTQAASAASDITLLDELGTITNKATLDTELASNYTATPIDITGSKAEKYQVYPGNGKDDGPVTYYSETVNLKPGLYKLSVDAFQREAGYDRVAGADGARGIIYLYAGDAKTQLKSVMDYGANDAYTQKANDWETPNFESGGKNYPNCEASAYAALETGNYTNDVYFYVASTGDVEIGIKNPSRLGGNFSTWCVYDNWTLTRYEKTPFTASFVNGEGWEHVYAYVWNPGSPDVIINGDWPGTELETKSGTATYNGEELDVYTYSYTSNDMPAKIIFNNGKAGDDPEKEQTDDLTFVDGMLDDSKVTKIPVYAVVGSKSGDDNDKAIFSAAWDQATTTDILTESAGTYSKTYTNQTLDKQTVKFKVIKKDYKEATTAKAWYPASDQTFSIPVKGIYNITITFNGNEGSPVVASVATKTAEAVTIGETGETDWATTVTNSALDFSGVTEFTAYTATVDGSTVTLNEVDDVQAETGLVLRGTAGTYYVPVTESSSTDKGSLSGNSLEGFTIHSNYADFYYGLKVTDGMAKFAQIQKPTGDDTFTIPAGKAFLIIHGDYARELSVVFAGETTTGIANMKAAKEDGLYYNLNGQRVNAPAKGLYIVNGKKVVKK